MEKREPMEKRKHVPMRRCIICRQSHPKRMLVRIVALPQGGLKVDPSGKRPGRGAYLCRQVDCWQKALSSTKVLANALRVPVSDEDRAALSIFVEQDLLDESRDADRL